MKVHRFLNALDYPILILVACLLPANVFGQTAATSRISGLVTDANGSVVAGAVVKLVDNTTKAEKTVTTNDDGLYVFASIDPGTYDLSVAAKGFRNTVILGVKADITEVTVRDVTVEPGSVSETVTVSATGDVLLKTDDATVGNTIDQRQLERLPTTNRRATALIILQPAVTPGGEVVGSRADQNTYSLDGLDVSDQVGFRGAADTVVPIPAESVEEFRVTVANPTASFGRSGGAQVTLVTKRGGNDFNGSAYWYHQNDNLNANSWSNNRLGLKRAEAKDNRFGATVGGPIWKDHTFFFFNYEGRRVPGSTQVTRIVPTQSYRDGLLRFLDASGVVNTFNPVTFDPRGLGSNPRITTYLKTLPLPNDLSLGDGGLNTGGFITNIPVTLRDDFGVLRLDHKINSNWSVEARGSLYRSINTSAGQANIVDLKPGAAFNERPKNFTIGVIGTIRSNFVNEARFGHAFDNFVLSVIDPSTIAGFNVAVDVAGTDEAIDVDTQRARRQSLGGGTTQYVDNATWTKGTHTFQFGGTLRDIETFHLRNDKVIGSLSTPVAAVGNFTGAVVIPAGQRPAPCSTTVTTNCLRPADASRYNQLYSSLLGIVDNVGYLGTRDANLGPNPIGTPLINNARLKHWEFYFADTWRLKPSLTLSYGVQYQWHTPPKDELDRQTLLAYKDTLELIDPLDYMRQKREAAENGQIFNPDIAYVPVTAAGKDVFKINRKNFSPRLSLAWQPSFSSGLMGSLFGERMTVIRGGYGLLFDRLNTVSSVVVPMLGVGFAQTLSFRAPLNAAGLPFRVGVDGPIPVPVNTAVTSPVVPAKPFGETLSFSLDPNIKDPYNHAIDFTIQRELPGNMLLEVGYLGRYARNLYQNLNLTSTPYFHKDPASGQTFAQAFDAVARQLRTGTAAANVTAQPWFTNQIPALGAAATAFLAANQGSSFIDGNLNSLWNLFIDFFAPRAHNNQQSLDLFMRTSIGRSSYNAGFLTLHKRLSSGYTFDVNYTYSKSLDQVGGIQNFVTQLSSSFDPDLDYAPSDFDRTHILNANFVYDLPFGNGRRFSTGNWADKLIGGWYLSGIYTASSGVPLTVVQGFQVYGAGAIFGAPVGAIPRTSSNVGNSLHTGVTGSGGIGTSGNPATRGTGLNLFADPAAVFANFRKIELDSDRRSGRGLLRGFSRWNFDFSVGKETKIGERMRLTITGDFFNLFNRVNFNNPSLFLFNQATFGVVTSAFGSRRIQLGGRFEF